VSGVAGEGRGAVQGDRGPRGTGVQGFYACAVSARDGEVERSMGGEGGREMKRDMTEKQFLSACARYGFKRQGFMGYFDVGNGLHVSVFNAGMRRRD